MGSEMCIRDSGIILHGSGRQSSDASDGLLCDTHGTLSVCILYSDRSVCRSAWIVRICLQLVADQKLCLGVCIIIWMLLFYDALFTVY